MLHDEVLGPGTTLAQMIVADVLLAHIFNVFDVDWFEALDCSCKVVQSVTWCNVCSSIGNFLVQTFYECWFFSVQPIVFVHAFEE